MTRLRLVTLPTAKPPQLSEQNLRELAAARVALKKINRAVSVAKFDGWTMGILGGFSFLLGWLSGDWVSLVAGMVLVSCAWIELKGAGLLRQLEPRATRMLGMNQLGLGAMLVIYSLWQIWAQHSGHGAIADLSGGDPDVAQALGPYQGVVNYLVIGFYLLVMLVAIVGMGLMSRYYFGRQKYLEAYLNGTPGWILEMQRAGVSI
jgi:hypothetical protein